VFEHLRHRGRLIKSEALERASAPFVHRYPLAIQLPDPGEGASVAQIQQD
jgi:hypothetical protein